MQVHANAKLVPSSRLLLVRRVLEERWKIADVAAALGVSERTAYLLTGAAALGVGIVVLAGWWNGRLQLWLAATNRDGWLFVAVGGATVLVALLAPVWAVGGRRAVATTSAEDL